MENGTILVKLPKIWHIIAKKHLNCMYTGLRFITTKVGILYSEKLTKNQRWKIDSIFFRFSSAYQAIWGRLQISIIYKKCKPHKFRTAYRLIFKISFFGLKFSGTSWMNLP